MLRLTVSINVSKLCVGIFHCIQNNLNTTLTVWNYSNIYPMSSKSGGHFAANNLILSFKSVDFCYLESLKENIYFVLVKITSVI